MNASVKLICDRVGGGSSRKVDLNRIRTHRADLEFLPADLEILETPPSPIRMAFIVAICALFAFALGWSYLSHVDIIAIAQGKIQPTGRVKVIEPLEPGRVAAINVENGQHVKAGDVLVELERGDARAEETSAASLYASSSAEAARRRAAIDAAHAPTGAATPTPAWADDIPLAIRAREKGVLIGDLAHLRAQLSDIDAQINQKTVEREHLDGTIKAQRDLIATLQERVTIKETLLAKGFGARTAVIDARESLQYQTTTLQGQLGQRDQASESLKVLAEEREKAIAYFVADNEQKMAEAQRQADDLAQKLAKAQLKSGRLALTTPIDGYVMSLSATTIGQVVSSAEEIARVIPEDTRLEIEAYLPNQDIGFVHKGQNAVVKVDAFPFTRYGVINARVVRVAHDAIADPDAQAAEADASRANKTSKMFAAAQRMQNSVFPVTLELDKNALTIDGEEVALTPGMSVSVEIATGRRRLLEYLISPVAETASNAFKDR